MRNRRLLLAGIGITVLAVLILSQVAVSPSVLAKGNPHAKVVWSQNPVAATVAPGTSYSTTITFTSGADLTNATLRLTPSLKGTTVVSPTTFATITAGVPYTVEIDVTMPVSTTQGAYNGVLTVRTGNRAYASPLKLRFSTGLGSGD
ncbi:MAG: hypothetical protein WCF84_25430 [Anaerolineae bacterium]